MDRNAALVDHYNRTFDVTLKLWQQRNSTFLVLLLVVGIANLFSNRQVLLATLQTIFEHMNMKLGNLDGAAGFYETVQTILLILVFYLMVQLYNRSTTVVMNYAYLGRLESEIRWAFAFGPRDIAFTRESQHYWYRRPLFFSLIKYFYVLIIGALMAFYYWVRLSQDRENLTMLIVDGIVGVPTLVVFLAYAYQSIVYDRPAKPAE